MVEVRWSDEALTRLELIKAYVEQFDRAAADRLARRLVEAAFSLEHFPHRGRPAGRGCRELTTVRPYVLRYEVDKHGVTILRLRHGAELPERD